MRLTGDETDRERMTAAALVRSGLLGLEHFAVTDFPLEEANEAVAHAADEGGRFKLTPLRP